MFIREAESIELIKHPLEFALLALIAQRAKRTTEYSEHNLEVGEALIGDHKSHGASPREYRTAKLRLEKWGFSTFKTTNKGTIAKITNSSVFDINTVGSDKQNDDQTTNKRQTSDKQATTNKNDKNDKNDKNKKNYCSTSIEIELSQCLLDLILKRNPAYKRPDIQKWAIHIDRMIRIDKREPGGIQEVISWSQSDDFWQNNILSTKKLRRQFDQLFLKMNSGGTRKTRLYEEAQSILEFDGERNFLNYCKENNLKPEEVKSWSL